MTTTPPPKEAPAMTITMTLDPEQTNLVLLILGELAEQRAVTKPNGQVDPADLRRNQKPGLRVVKAGGDA